MALRLLLPALRPCGLLPKLSVLCKEHKCPQLVAARGLSKLIPRSQYDEVFPKKMRLRTILVHHWEVIPLFVVTLSSVALLCFSIIWAIRNKVDVTFGPHARKARKNISRSMNLRHPTAHKFILIHQRYEPWPEMQKSLDKLKKAQCLECQQGNTCIKKRVKRWNADGTENIPKFRKPKKE